MLIEYSRTPPSSWAEETRKTFDHCGQGLSGVALVGRAGDDLELVDARAQPWRCDGAQAVGAGVAAADDDHVLAVGGDERARRCTESPAHAAVLER